MRVIVVGAGVVGASTAFHLADAGADVMVIDRAHVGRATPAGAGLLCPWPTEATDETFVELYVAGAEALPGIVERLHESGQTETGYRRVGAIRLAHDDTDLAATEQRIAERTPPASIIGDVHRITGREAQQRFPALRDDLPGLWIEGGARLDGRTMTAALLGAAGTEPRNGEADLVVRGDRVRGVSVDGERIDADAVVVAGGAWSTQLLAAHGIGVDVEPQKGQIVHVAIPDSTGSRPTGDWPSILAPGPHYLLGFEGGTVVVGATRETGSGFDTRITAAGQREILDAALRWAPGLADATVLETRVGLRPLARSGRPTIGPAPGVAGLWINTGLGATGLTIGPLAGRTIADQILDS